MVDSVVGVAVAVAANVGIDDSDCVVAWRVASIVLLARGQGWSQC